MQDDVLTQIFGSQLPRESFLKKTHPCSKLVTMVIFPIMAIIFYNSYYSFIVLLIYLFLVSLNNQNPLKPWFVWVFVILISLLVYYIFPENTFFEKFTILSFTKLSIAVFLIIAPFTQIANMLNPYELLQTIPKKLNWVGMIIITFARYAVVSKQQFIQTKLAFAYRNINIQKVIFLFVSTLIDNVMRHSAKFADNIEIRNLNNPKLLYDKPTLSVNDYILYGLYLILLGLGLFFVWFWKI